MNSPEKDIIVDMFWVFFFVIARRVYIYLSVCVYM
jgi:hypothetical protein